MKIRTAAAVILGLLALALEAAPQDRPAPPAPPATDAVTLRDAAAAGMLRVHGFDPASYREVTLKLRNLTDGPLEIDLCASYLHPKKKGSCQRLGLGPPVTPTPRLTGKKGKLLLTLAAGEEFEVRLNTVCLDAGLPCPPSNMEYVPAPDALPAVREQVLRWWVEHPATPQSAVNSAVWRYSSEVRVTGGTHGAYAYPVGLHPRLLGGMYYQLRDGELTSVDSDGVVRILGTEIFTPLPTAAAVLAVGLGSDGGAELWRLALTGEEPWVKVMDVPAGVVITGVVRDGDPLVLLTDQGLLSRDPRSGEVRRLLSHRQLFDLTVHDPGGRRLACMVRVPGSDGYHQGGELKGESQDVYELVSVDLETGREELLKRFWNVREARAGASGIYGLSHRGNLRRLVGDDFRDMPGTRLYSRLVAVGPRTIWLADEESRLVAVAAGSGAVRFETKVRVDEGDAFEVDPVTGDLATVGDGVFYRIDAGDGLVRPVPQDQ